MPIDTSIYNNLKPIDVDLPSPMAGMEGMLRLSTLGLQNQQAQLQNRQAQYQMGQLQAIRSAYAANMKPDGTVDQPGVLTALSKAGYGQSANEVSQQFSAQNKAQAEAQKARSDAEEKAVEVALPHLEYLDQAPGDQKPTLYHSIMKQLADKNLPMTSVPPEFSQDWLNNTMDTIKRTPTYLAQQQAQANILKSSAEARKANADAAKAESETYKRNPDILGQTNDPARLIPGYVPKEHQAQAFNEVDAAENTKRMSASIMDSFDQAAEAVQGLGRGVAVGRTPRSALALHQALQPTFKDLEGTVRQAAMDNTFRNVTPNPFDTDADIAIKRKALQNYLQSKASAPTARAYGINLNQYPSTAPYRSTPPKTPPGSPEIGTASANETPQVGGFSLNEIRAELGRRKSSQGKKGN